MTAPKPGAPEEPPDYCDRCGQRITAAGGGPFGCATCEGTFCRDCAEDHTKDAEADERA